jgi:hypothetical protein
MVALNHFAIEWATSPSRFRQIAPRFNVLAVLIASGGIIVVKAIEVLEFDKLGENGPITKIISHGMNLYIRQNDDSEPQQAEWT